MRTALTVVGLTYATLGMGCPATTPYGSAAGSTGSTHRASGATSNGTSGATGTSGAGGTSSGSSTSGTMDAGCNSLPPLREVPLDDCPSGTVETLFQLTKVCSEGAGVPASGVQLGVLENAGLTANTDVCGRGHFCLPPSVPSSIELQLPNYPTTIAGTIAPDGGLAVQAIQMICTQVLSDFATIATGQVLSANDSTVVVFVDGLRQDDTSEDKSYADAGCYDLSGWSFTLIAPDGGAVAATPCYVSGFGSCASTGETSGIGFMMFFGIDPTVGSVRVSGTRSNNALSDGGVLCALANSRLALTGNLPVRAGDLSIQVYDLLPTDPSAFPQSGSSCAAFGECVGNSDQLTCVSSSGICCGNPLYPYPCTTDSQCCGGACGSNDVCCFQIGGLGCLNDTNCCTGTCEFPSDGGAGICQ